MRIVACIRCFSPAAPGEGPRYRTLLPDYAPYFEYLAQGDAPTNNGHLIWYAIENLYNLEAQVARGREVRCDILYT